MVEINNQRKAFLDMLAWSEGTDNGRQKTREIMVMVTSLWAESYLLITRSPSLENIAKPKTQINRRRTLQLLSRWWDAYRKQLSLKDFSRKVRTLWHCSRLRSVALYLWLIVVISVERRPLQQYLGFTARALVMVSSSIKADSLIAKFKEAGGTVREIDVWASHRDYLRSGYLPSSSACHGLLIITVTNASHTAKPSATKMPENWSWRTRQLLTCGCVSVMLLLDAEIRESYWC